jgi:hypothetical protein
VREPDRRRQDREAVDEETALVTSAARKLLDRHLATWLGRWPPDGPITVATAPGRSQPGWDRSVAPVIGIRSPEGTVVSVPPDLVDVSTEWAEQGGLEALARGLAEFLPFPAPRLFIGGFRWSGQVPDLPDGGEWVAPIDPAAPQWLRPYQEALIRMTPSGCTGAIGIKHHDPYGHELTIRVSPRIAAQHGIRGLARLLGAQAARKVLADGAVPTAILRAGNIRSDQICAATGSTATSGSS